ncbi:MAG: hypothetical protein ACTSPB_00165 [Candidatus Thorarchaeota archaeon]
MKNEKMIDDETLDNFSNLIVYEKQASCVLLWLYDDGVKTKEELVSFITNKSEALNIVQILLKLKYISVQENKIYLTKKGKLFATTIRESFKDGE